MRRFESEPCFRVGPESGYGCDLAVAPGGQGSGFLVSVCEGAGEVVDPARVVGRC